MRRTTPLTAMAVLGLALLAPASVATAAGETCRGEAATIAGTGRTLVGTEGRDVIVTGDATEVDGLGGDDLICVLPGRYTSNVLYVDAGSGNDVVDTTGTPGGYYVDADLGPGADSFEGGPSGDWVDTDGAAGSQGDLDVVVTGSGDDIVETAGGSDRVDLGPGNNTLRLEGPGTNADGRLAGGEGYDTFVIDLHTPAEHVLDMAAGTYRTAGASADFTSFEALSLRLRGARVRLTGTDRDDYVDVRSSGEASIVVADLLGGDDSLNFNGSHLGAGSTLDLGTGTDRIVAARKTGRLGLDLTRDELTVGSRTVPTTGAEDAILMARRVTMVGDAHDNSFSVFACTSDVRGGRGDDELIWQGDHIFEQYSFQCPKTATLRGGRGKDVIYGGPGPDRLFGNGGDDTIRGYPGEDLIRGGKGRDKADGGPGRDRCDAEKRKSCER